MKECLEAMNTEKLQALLQDESLDGDELLAILEILKNRNALDKAEIRPVDAAWQSFQEEYLPYANDPRSLYEDAVDEPAQKIRKFSLLHRRSLIGTIAAAMLVILLTGAFSAAATINRSWKYVLQYQEDGLQFVRVFDFTPTLFDRAHGPDDVAESDHPIIRELHSYGIYEPIIFETLPERYALSSYEKKEIDGRRCFRFSYETPDADSVIVLMAELLTGEPSLPVSCDREAFSYMMTLTLDGIEHSIYPREDDLLVVWVTDHCACTLTGVSNYNTLVDLLFSLYYPGKDVPEELYIG